MRNIFLQILRKFHKSENMKTDPSITVEARMRLVAERRRAAQDMGLGK